MISNAFAQIYLKAKESAMNLNKEEPGDFYKDGLLHCGVCGEKKQHAVSIPAIGVRDDIVYCLCNCGLARREYSESLKRRSIHESYVRDLNARCFDSRYFTAMTFANSDTRGEAYTICEDWCKTYQNHRGIGAGLLLFGDVGTGKTYLAAAICNALMSQGVACKMISFPDLANKLSSTYNKTEVYEDLDQYEILVIDDLGIERTSGYMSEIMETVIDRRYRIKFPVIITTNLTLEDIDNPVNTAQKRLFSRLTEMTMPVKVSGVDRRKQ